LTKSTAELSDLVAHPHAEDPNASEFRFEYDGILHTYGFNSKKADVSRPGPGTLAKTLDVLRDEPSTWMGIFWAKPNCLP
jgi:hypothetical protein